MDLGLSESDEDEDDEKKAARKERRLGREIKLLHNKLNKLKIKQEAAKKERESLKQAMKKNQILLKYDIVALLEKKLKPFIKTLEKKIRNLKNLKKKFKKWQLP